MGLVHNQGTQFSFVDVCRQEPSPLTVSEQHLWGKEDKLVLSIPHPTQYLLIFLLTGDLSGAKTFLSEYSYLC